MKEPSTGQTGANPDLLAGTTAYLCQGLVGMPSPPFRGEREGPVAERWEGEVGIGHRSGIPHLTPTLSAPRGGEGVADKR